VQAHLIKDVPAGTEKVQEMSTHCPWKMELGGEKLSDEFQPKKELKFQLTIQEEENHETRAEVGCMDTRSEGPQ
jgi:hypothetical protein